MIEQLDQFVLPARGSYPSNSMSICFGSISTIEKKFDCLQRAPGRDVYHYIPVNCLRDLWTLSSEITIFLVRGDMCYLSTGACLGGANYPASFPRSS